MYYNTDKVGVADSGNVVNINGEIINSNKCHYYCLKDFVDNLKIISYILSLKFQSETWLNHY